MSGDPFFSPSRWEDEYRWHGDMLADTQRNHAYAKAIEIWVTNAAAAARQGVISGDQQAPPVVLEIGTGSGLLSSLLMQAIEQHWPAALPPPEVFAVEVVPTLHEMAQKTFAKLPPPPAPQVTLLPRMHSLALPAELLPSRGASLVLGELLDTGLLGEGLVESMRDAKERLTASDGYEALPARGRVFATPCEGLLIHRLGGLRSDEDDEASTEFVNRSEVGCAGGSHSSNESGHGSLDSLRLGERSSYGSPASFRAPRACSCCPGSAAAEGMHVWWSAKAELECGALPGTLGSLAQMPTLRRRWGNRRSHERYRGDGDGNGCDEVWPLAPPQEVLDMDFSDPPLKGRREVVFTCAKAGTVHGVVYWWRVDMLSESMLRGAVDATVSNESISGTSAAFKICSSVEDEVGAAKQGSAGPFMSTVPGDTAAPDHWRQNVVPLPQPITVEAGSKLVMTACHDADMLWFEGVQVLPAVDSHAEGIELINDNRNIASGGTSDKSSSSSFSTSSSSSARSEYGPPVCSCGLHSTHSRGRLVALNSPQRRRVLAAVADHAADAWAQQKGEQQQDIFLQRELSDRALEMQQFGGVERVEAIRRGDKDESSESKAKDPPFSPTGLAVVLGDGPLLPFMLAARGFRVLVADRVGQRQQRGQGNENDEASSGRLRRWLTERCLDEAGLGGRVTFTDAGEEGDEDSDDDEGSTKQDRGGDAALGGAATALRRAVVRELMHMRRSKHSNQSDTDGRGSSNHNSSDGNSNCRNDVVGLAGVFSEPFFPALDEPGSHGDGWGFDSLLVLRRAFRAFPQRDEQRFIINSSNSSSNEIAHDSIPQIKRQKTENRQNSTTTSSSISDLSPQIKRASCPSIISPARAVLRGALVKCRDLWDSMRPLKPGDLEGVTNLSPAFEYSNNDHSESCGEKLEVRVQESDDAPIEQKGPFLRQAATGNVAIDAMPFNLAQWPTAEVVAGPVDLLDIDLQARLRLQTVGKDDALNRQEEVLAHTSRLQYSTYNNFNPDSGASNLAFDEVEKDGSCDGSSATNAAAGLRGGEDEPSDQHEQEATLAPEEAHVLAIWIDYDLGPQNMDVADFTNSSDGANRWLLHGPGVWHGRQGVLALTEPLVLTEGTAIDLRTCLKDLGDFTIELA